MAPIESAAPVVISDPLAMAGGYKIIISVEAIREKLGGRWSLKENAVWEFAQRQFEKGFPRTDAIRKLTDVDYLIAQASEEGTAAQFKAMDLLKSILTFFLGEATLANVNLSIVRSIKDGIVEAEALSQAEIQALDCAALGAPAAAAEPKRMYPPNQFQLNVTLERVYEIVVLVDPIWTVYKHAVASYHLRPIVFECTEEGKYPVDLDAISLRDVLSIHVAILKAATAAIRDGQANERSFALNIPVHFRCLRSLSCRSELARLLPSFADIRRFLVFRILGLPDGAPKGVLAEAIAALRPHGVGVVVQVSSMNANIRRWNELSFSGIAYDFIDEVQSGTEIINRAKEFGSTCASVTTVLFGHGISTRAMLLAALSAGFTHISGDPISEKLPEFGPAVRFLPEDIYS